MTWVDLENIFLMGHSEGANAIAVTKLKGVRGVILSSGFCQNGISFDNELNGLVMNFLNDPWHQGSTSRCLVKSNRSGNLVYEESNNIGHDTFDESKFRVAVVDFLKKHKK
jgi:hypothetical protein